MPKHTQHTPGPWKPQHSGTQLWIEPRICVVVEFPKYEAERDANARLIAAAPDMDNLLSNILDEVNLHGSISKHHPYFNGVRETLAAVEGRDDR